MVDCVDADVLLGLLYLMNLGQQLRYWYIAIIVDGMVIRRDGVVFGNVPERSPIQDQVLKLLIEEDDDAFSPTELVKTRWLHREGILPNLATKRVQLELFLGPLPFEILLDIDHYWCVDAMLDPGNLWICGALSITGCPLRW
jgi:hypothetical protein